MRCPKCGFISFDYLNSCGKCSNDLASVISQLHYSVPIKIGNVFFLEPALRSEVKEKAGTEGTRIAISSGGEIEETDEITLDLSEIDSEEAINIDGIELPNSEALHGIDMSGMKHGDEPEHDILAGHIAHALHGLPMGTKNQGGGDLTLLEEDDTGISLHLLQMSEDAAGVKPIQPTTDEKTADSDSPGLTLKLDSESQPATSSPRRGEQAIDLDFSLDTEAGQGLKDTGAVLEPQDTVTTGQLSIELEEINLSDLVPLDSIETDNIESVEDLDFDLGKSSAGREEIKAGGTQEKNGIFDLSDIMADAADYQPGNDTSGPMEADLTLLDDFTQESDDLDFSLAVEAAQETARETPTEKKNPSRKKKKADRQKISDIPDLGLTLEKDE